MKRKAGSILLLALVLVGYGLPMASLVVFAPKWLDLVGWAHFSPMMWVSFCVCSVVGWAFWLSWRADRLSLMVFSTVGWGFMNWGSDGNIFFSVPSSSLISFKNWDLHIQMGLGYFKFDGPLMQVDFPVGALIVLLAFALGRWVGRLQPQSPT